MTTLAELIQLIEEAGFEKHQFKGEYGALSAHICGDSSERKSIIVPWLFLGRVPFARVFKANAENYELFKGLLPSNNTVVFAPTELEEFVRTYHATRDALQSPLVALPDPSTINGEEFLCEVYELGYC